ncbi:MAG TPA: hypothetical protein VF815_20565 [Myxococcaceae bacterium]
MPSRFKQSVARGASVALALGMVAAGVAVVRGQGSYDPLEVARLNGMAVHNREAPIPSMCYTKTEGRSNPCWTCHTGGVSLNSANDLALQTEYAFSEVGLTNHWKNLFVDRRPQAAAITDEQALAYIREDNYTPLREAMQAIPAAEHPGFRPDLDFSKGFDEDGFARDGSGWRAVRYKPFLGTFWPTNGSTDDVFIRLPPAFRRDASGAESRAIYQLNLSLVEVAMTLDPTVHDNTKHRRVVEPLDERVGGLDLNGDGQLTEAVTEVKGVPARYVGAAAKEPLRGHLYPEGTEFLHTVRYVDPDQPTLLSTRMKEVRYSRKVAEVDTWKLMAAYESEFDDKSRGRLPVFQGAPDVGLMNDFGWQLQGFIEDGKGRLRLQTQEEHLFCMGCHSNIGVTADQTFSFPRKVPGKEGWRHQDLRGIPDVPQVGHGKPETLVYFERVQGGDEFRANDELLQRFFPGGTLDEAAVRRAAKGGDQDLAALITPSRERALRLNKAYMVLVREQAFTHGRDTMLAPPANVHPQVENGSTGLEDAGRVYQDGRLHLSW